MNIAEFLDDLKPMWEPHAGQRHFLLSEAKTRVLACGRRWGKTEVCAALIAYGVSNGETSRHLIVAPTLSQARELFDRVITFLRKINIEVKPKYSPYPSAFVDDHEIVARSGHRPDSLRGQEATHIVVDEAAFVDDRLIQSALYPMLATTDGELTLISTPNGFNGFFQFFQRGQEGTSGIWSLRGPSEENPKIRPEFLRAQQELVSERRFRTEYQAEFLDDQHSVFRSELIDEALTDDLGEVEAPYYIGIDWARYHDNTAYMVLSGTRQGVALVEAGTIFRVGWNDQTAAIAKVIHRYPTAHVVIDASTIGDAATDMLQELTPDITLERFPFNQNSKQGLIEGLVGLFERKTIRMLPDPVLVRELRAFRQSEGKLGGHREHDDRVIALALAAFHLPKEYGNSILVGDPKPL